MMKNKYKILNLYACLGGNRYKWNEVSENIEVTAIEIDPELAKLYKERFPSDIVIVADAHKYLLENYKNFDFIWTSPPCPTHSKARYARRETTSPEYPDMKLYQEIIFLDKWFNGKYVIENVIPYYSPLIPAQKRGRHLYWANFKLPSILSERKCNFMEGKNEVEKWIKFHKIDLTNYNGKQRRDKIARNLVDYVAGKTILQTALNIHIKNNTKQFRLFV
jgi:DNA (cytosine-5)-methyltransferase 1